MRVCISFKFFGISIHASLAGGDANNGFLPDAV